MMMMMIMMTMESYDDDYMNSCNLREHRHAIIFFGSCMGGGGLLRMVEIAASAAAEAIAADRIAQQQFRHAMEQLLDRILERERQETAARVALGPRPPQGPPPAYILARPPATPPPEELVRQWAGVTRQQWAAGYRPPPRPEAP